MTVRSVDLNRFKDAVGFIPQFSCRWGNSRKANIAAVNLQMAISSGNLANAQTALADVVNEDKAKESKAKDRMQLKKQLIVSKEYDAIKAFQSEVRSWVYRNTVPSFFKEGFQLVNLAGVEPIEQRMKKAVSVELPKLVDAFLEAYPAQIDEARKVLEPVGQFNANDYPTVADMRQMFAISWNWISFTVPEGLPEELRKAEQEKLAQQFTDAGAQITAALRVGFAELVKHAKERLEPSAPGEKPKKIYDSMLGNIQEFLDTFNQRNLLNDVELAQLVARAREVLTGVTTQKVREYANVRENLQKGLAEITEKVSALIVEPTGRRFDFSDESPAETTATEPETPAVA